MNPTNSSIPTNWPISQSLIEGITTDEKNNYKRIARVETRLLILSDVTKRFQFVTGLIIVVLIFYAVYLIQSFSYQQLDTILIRIAGLTILQVVNLVIYFFYHRRRIKQLIGYSDALFEKIIGYLSKLGVVDTFGK